MNSINNNPMDLSNALCVTVGMLPLFLLVQLIQLFANGPFSIERFFMISFIPILNVTLQNQ